MYFVGNIDPVYICKDVQSAESRYIIFPNTSILLLFNKIKQLSHFHHESKNKLSVYLFVCLFACSLTAQKKNIVE